MKKLLCAALALLLFTACAGTRYAADVPLGELCTRALDALGEEEYRLDTVGITDDYFTMPDYVTECAILYSSRTDCINELGIFFVEDGRAKEFAALLRDSYLLPAYEKNREFYDSYIPSETPKLRDARVETFGNAVVYAILPTKEASDLFSAIRIALAK